VGFDRQAGLRDLWAGSEVSANGDSYTATVPSHGAVLLKITK
jgi:hypothetical protein